MKDQGCGGLLPNTGTCLLQVTPYAVCALPCRAGLVTCFTTEQNASKCEGEATAGMNL